MGRVVAAHGTRGWVKIQPFTEYLDTLLDYETWWLGNEYGPWRNVKLEKSEVHNKTLAALLADCPDRTAAEKLKGQLVAVPRSSLPEHDGDEHYWSDLIGMAVVNGADERLGTVTNLIETGANDVLNVKGENGEILIPFVASAIRQVDVKNRIIRVDWALDY